MMYSAASRNSSSVALRPRFSSTGLALLADRVEQVEVLHVARADLQHVGVLRDQRDLLDAITSVTTARPVSSRLGEQFKPLLRQSLERVRAGPRLERPAAQADRAGLLAPRGRSPASALRLSTLHGPAITPTFVPPTRGLPALTSGTTVRSFFTSVDAILYGARIGTTLLDAFDGLERRCGP